MDTIHSSTRGLAVDWGVWTLCQARVAATTVLALLLTWYLRSRSRHHLAGLDARGLKDIGLSRADVAREVDKPFWR